jgi:repressor LexA
MMMPATEKQQKILDFIKSFRNAKGYSPTVREIGAEVGINSTNGVVCHLNALEKKGLVARTKLTARSIIPT